MNAFVLRPIKLKDLNQLKQITQEMSSPIASLPNDKKLLKSRIELSLRSFKKTVSQPSREYYLFVLEDLVNKKIVGTSAISARVGGQNFFFAYKIQKETFSYPPLNISKSVDVLHFKKIAKGPSELCSLYLTEELRNQHLGKLLSFGRCFFISTFNKRFTTEIVANLKGFRDQESRSPFWKALGKVFFGMSLAAVDTMKSFGHKSFIRALMPRHPIYIPLLPPEAQDSISTVAEDTQPALHLLEKQGFKKGEWVDIFDAGPFVKAKQNEIKLIQNMNSGIIENIVATPNNKKLPEYMIANSLIDFRACLGDIVQLSNGNIQINSNIAEILNVKIGDSVSYVKY